MSSPEIGIRAEGITQELADSGLDVLGVRRAARRRIIRPARPSRRRCLTDVLASTAYDALVDEEIVDVMDATLARHPWLGFALPIDLNAYGPMHNSNFCHDWTGEHDRDVVGNRIKRFFWDGDLLVRGARVGIECCPASQMATRAEFAAARAELHEPAGGDPRYLVQTYARDTGAVMSVLTAPIYVHGERWGAVLLGWDAAALQALA